MFATPVISAHDDIYVAEFSGALHALAPNGDKKWTIQLNSPNAADPLAIGASGTVYVRAFHDLAAVEPGGHVKWHAPLVDEPTPSAVVPDKNETVYVVSRHQIEAFAAADGKRLKSGS